MPSEKAGSIPSFFKDIHESNSLYIFYERKCVNLLCSLQQQKKPRITHMEKYIVKLTRDEREYLLSLIKKGKTSAYKLTHARILLEADENNGEEKTDAEIAEQLHVGVKTVKRIRKRLVEEGIEEALSRKPHVRTRSRKLGGEEEAYLIALTCSQPPEGRNRWTLKLLSDRMVEVDRRNFPVSHTFTLLRYPQQ